jgi:serine/threonine protein phosphatase PrpC
MEALMTPYCWTSGGVTDQGRRRKVNQDAFLDRPDLGLWAVADGMGGHRDGARASRALVEALALLPRPRLLGAAADAVRGVLTEVQALVDQGVLAPEQAENHPYGNVLARAIGAEPTVEIDSRIEALRAGDRYLLCSDGLDKELSDAEIAVVLAAAAPASAARALVDHACAAGGRDNVTAVVIQFDAA